MKKPVPVFIIMTLLLELYPKGVMVSRIAAPDERFTDWHFYFSMTPYWLGNRYPLLTAILTCVLAILCLTGIIRRKQLAIPMMAAAIPAVLFFILAVWMQYDNLFGYCITGMLAMAILSLIITWRDAIK